MSAAVTKRSDAPAALMASISRIEVLAGYLATHNRQMADTIALLQERGAIDPALIDDGLALAAMDAEHLADMRRTIEATCAALRSERRTTTNGSDALATAARARAAAVERLEELRTPDGGWQHEALQGEIDAADVALARHVANDAAGVLAQVTAALGHCIANDRDAEVALAAGDFDALAEGDIDFPAKILAQALRGLRNLSARETGA